MISERPRARTFTDLLDEMAGRHRHREAIVWRGQRLDWTGWRDRSAALAGFLQRNGVGPGDRVAILLPNRPEWLISVMAAVRLGAVAVPISTFSSPRELAWTLAHCEPAALVLAPAFGDRDWLAALRRAERVPDCVITVDDAPVGTPWDRALAGEPATGPGPGPEDTCFILYTSGSTADPKGVTLLHRDVIANGFDIGERQHLTADDRLWCAIPLFWSFGAANALPAVMSHGGTLVLQERFDPGTAIRLIREEGCTVFYGMVNMVRAMRDHPDWSPEAFASMRTGLTIGLAREVAFMVESLSAPQLCTVYGSTETCGNCAVSDALDPLDLRLATQGLPLPGMQIRAVDPQTRAPLPDGTVGELAVRGHVTPGYFRAPELTARAFDADGWFLTGDLGLVGTDGRVRFRGRIRELIKTGGINVSPLEVETVLVQHPDVREAHVIGLADPDRDEVVAAVVEPVPGRTVDPAVLRTWCRELLAAYKVPATIRLAQGADLPRTATGKIHKPGLPALFDTAGVQP